MLFLLYTQYIYGIFYSQSLFMGCGSYPPFVSVPEMDRISPVKGAALSERSGGMPAGTKHDVSIKPALVRGRIVRVDLLFYVKRQGRSNLCSWDAAHFRYVYLVLRGEVCSREKDTIRLRLAKVVYHDLFIDNA